jgi:hypothetical protein
MTINPVDGILSDLWSNIIVILCRRQGRRHVAVAFNTLAPPGPERQVEKDLHFNVLAQPPRSSRGLPHKRFRPLDLVAVHEQK